MSKRIILNNRTRWAIFFIVNLILFCVFAIFLPIRYEENDDVIMCWIASGFYSGTPDPHLVFINYIFGLMISSLYKLNPNIEWYTILLYLIHVISVTVIVKVITETKKSKILIISFLILLYVLEIRNILLLQFTTTSSIMAIAGLLLIVSSERTVRLVFGGILFVLASLIRFDAAMLVGFLFAVFYFYNNKLFKDLYSLKFITLVLLFILSTSLYGVNSIIYKSNADWRYYFEYNKVRGKINDNPNSEFVELKDLPNGLTMNDFLLLTSFFPDTHKITFTKLEQISQNLSKVPLKNKIKNLYYPLKSNRLILLLLFALVLFYGVYEYFKFRRLGIFIVYLMFVFLMIFISLNATVKQRVVASMVLTFFVFFVYYHNDSTHRAIVYIISCILFLNVVLWSFRINKIRIANKWQKEVYHEQYTLISNLDKNNIIVPFMNDFKIEFISAFSLSKEIDNQFNFFGWLSLFPKNKINTHQDLLKSNYVLFCSKNNYSYFIKSLTTSLLETYGISTTVNNIKESDNYIIFKLMKNDPF